MNLVHSKKLSGGKLFGVSGFRKRTTVPKVKQLRLNKWTKWEGKSTSITLQYSIFLGTNKMEDHHQKEQLLNEEKIVIKNRDLTLEEREDILNQKERELSSKKNSLINAKSMSLQTVSKPLQTYEADSSTTIQSTGIFTNYSEHLSERKKEQETESEYSSSFRFNKDDFVQVEDFRALQRYVQKLKEETNETRSTLTEMDDLKKEIEKLRSRIKSLEMEKQENKSS